MGGESMLKKRKLIGVIVSEVEELYQQKLLKGIITQCYSLDYDVAIFSTFIRDTDLPEYKMGEKNIYQLINFDLFDGILVAGVTLAMPNLRQEIEQLLLKKCKCPVLYIDLYSEHFPFIYTDDRKASEQITDHLIDCHKYKKIYCLAADPNTAATISRVAGFKDSMLKHNIEVKENMISYDGDYYYCSGEAFARKIINNEIERPEAVVCINDYMAIGLVNELERNGIHVPEDIAVTGYDATEEAALSRTVITTYSPPIKQTGVNAVCELSRLMTGVIAQPCNMKSSRLDVGRSCGCNDMEFMKRSVIHRLKHKSEDYKRLLESHMTETLTAVSSLEDCLSYFSKFLYLIKDYSDYYLCLCHNWDGSVHNYSEEDTYIRTGYTSKVTLAMASENRNVLDSNITFEAKNLIPDLWKDREKPKAYYITPMHFNDRTIGYSVLSYGDKVQAFDITYRNWSCNVMNALEYNRAHRKLYRSSFRDVLTGIYNRSGFNQNLPELIHEVISQKKKLAIVMADMDNLKDVNDSFGHKEGDNIISVVAGAFQSCCKDNDICARIGGDEFLFAGVVEEGVERGEEMIEAVRHYISIYNLKSKKPYQIEISMGACSDYIAGKEDMDRMLDTADQEMYLNKAQNKKRRAM
jgi:diguanylate cyclase (GGDEF)-like protein